MEPRCASNSKHLTVSVPRRGFRTQIQALQAQATCGVTCASLQLCILATTFSTATRAGRRRSAGSNSCMCAMPEQWKGKFWWPKEVNDAWYDHTTTPDPERDFAYGIARMRPEASQAARELVLSVMHKAFCYLPERRITAEQRCRIHRLEPS
jgi:hypothetical protein